MKPFSRFFASFLLVFVAWAGIAQAEEKLRIVRSDYVCMVNDAFMGKRQIPVEHAGKTYYGCCENCKKTLAKEQGARQAKDALTGKTVDKATAVIAAKEDDSVLYFADKAAFEAYQQKRSGK